VASTDDDDEEDEGHYDVISKSRRAAVAANSRRTHNPRFCHPYEIVVGDSDSTYAGFREELEAAISQRNSSLGQASDSRPHAAIDAGGMADPLYAGITDDSNASEQMSPPGVAVHMGIPSTYSSVISSAQQMQRLHLGDHAAEADATLLPGLRGDEAESPLLPPRNGNIDSFDGGPVSVASNTWSQLPDVMSSSSTADNDTNTRMTAVVGDHNVPLQELHLLHNNASDDAMPLAGNCHAQYLHIALFNVTGSSESRGYFS